MQKLWHDLAWEQFLSWQESGDVRTFRRVCRLIRDIDRNGYATTGKPEPLNQDLKHQALDFLNCLQQIEHHDLRAQYQ